MKSVNELTPREILAVAISLEETDGRVYTEFAERLRGNYPATAEAITRMREEETGHLQRLLALYREKFGDHIPPIRREDVKGFIKRKPLWLSKTLTVAQVRRAMEIMELETAQFYLKAAAASNDAATRQLLNALADEERAHQELAGELDRRLEQSGAKDEEARTQQRLFVLQVVQPGLAGLMDGSVSTLAPIFAAAFATHSSHDALVVGLAASVGAGISMGFTEAVSDDGALSGRGKPFIRGVACGLMTAVGGLGHTLPYLIHDFQLATGVAIAIVLVELAVIAWIRKRFMDTPFLAAAFQVIVGGLLVFLAGVLIGNA
ncbi:MAG: rubrerythrin [Verrucomicrobiales bacterium]|jgi:rubrerythrin|nr:rubrerythrin [Verrucomicrobiales bacterium]